MPEHKNRKKTLPLPQETSEVRTLLEWNAPGRPFTQRTKQFYMTGLLIMLFIEIILFLFSQYMLMLLVLSLVFVSFALESTPPRAFYYRVSTQGVMVEDRFFIWEELYDFYFKKESGTDVLHIGTKSFIPGELTLTVNEKDEEAIKETLVHFLPFREYIKPTFMEKAGVWLSKNFPLEK